MKKLSMTFLLTIVISLVYGQGKGLVFRISDDSNVSKEYNGLTFYSSVLNKSTVVLSIESHPKKSDYLHLNVGVMKNNSVKRIAVYPNDISVKAFVKNKSKEFESKDSQELTDKIEIYRVYMENSAQITQTQQAYGLIGVSALKKKLKKSIVGVTNPLKYSLLPNVELNEQNSNVLGLVLCDMLSRKTNKIEVVIPIEGETHSFMFNVEESKTVYPRKSFMTVAYNNSVNQARINRSTVSSNIMNNAGNAFNQGFQQGTQSYQTTNQTQSNYQANNQSNSSGLFNSSGTSTGTVTQKDADGVYRVKAKIKCNSCQGEGITKIGGIIHDCTRCRGKGYIGE